VQNQIRNNEIRNIHAAGRGFFAANLFSVQIGPMQIAAVLVALMLTVPAMSQAVPTGTNRGAAMAKLSPELADLSRSTEMDAPNPRPLSSGPQNSGSPSSGSGSWVRVIVQFQQRPASEHIARVQNLGGRFHRRLDLMQSGVFTVPDSALG